MISQKLFFEIASFKRQNVQKVSSFFPSKKEELLMLVASSNKKNSKLLFGWTQQVQ
jgi:hypothetical protein